MKRYLIVVIAIYGLALRTIGISSPFSDSMADVLNCTLANIARNYLRLGYLPIKFLAVMNTGPVIDATKLIYYADHPPLSPIILSLFYKIFGISEWSTRIVPVLFSIATLVVFFLFVRLFWNEALSYISTLFMATMPIQAIYSQMHDYQGSILLFFAIATLYFYSKKFLTGKKIYLKAFFLFFILSALTNWAVFFLVPFLAIHYLIYCRRGGRFRVSLYIMIVSIILFSFMVACLITAKGDLNIMKIFLWRAGLSKGHPGLSGWLYNIGSYSLYLFTPFAIVLSSLWFISNGARGPFSESKALVYILFLFGGLHVLIFNQGAYIHDYWLYYLAPALSLSSAIFLDRIGLRFSRRDIAILISGALIGLLVTNMVIHPAKRGAWVVVYFIFCVFPFTLSFLPYLKREAWLKRSLVVISLAFYLTFSCLQTIWERAYWRTDQNKRAGYYIKESSSPLDVFIMQEDFAPLAFYADRPRIIIDSLDEFKIRIENKQYQHSFFIMDYKRLKDSKILFEYLSKNYKMARVGGHLIFDIRRDG